MPICSWRKLLVAIQLLLFMIMFYVNNTDLESMIKQIFIKFDSSN